MKLSIVTTLYQSESYIEEFLNRISVSAEKLVNDDYEIILINDGSPDQSLKLSVSLISGNSHLKVVDLSRNFGHHNAIMAGLKFARGEYVFLIDVDLEEDPELLEDFWHTLLGQREDNLDVVFGIQSERKGGWFERTSGKIYYWFLNRLLNIDHEKNISTVRLMSSRYVEALLLHEEREIVISGLWVITGFKQLAKPIDKHSSSPTSYGLYRKFSHLINAVTSFSAQPLYLIFLSGLAISFFALLYVAYLLVNRFFFSMPMPGWTSVMASIWLLGGVIISFIGVIGIYLAKIFAETKSRPSAIVRNVYGRD